MYNPTYGKGKVIYVSSNGLSELVYYFKENPRLHDGALGPFRCKNLHGWWYSPNEIEEMKTIMPLREFILRRNRQCK